MKDRQSSSSKRTYSDMSSTTAHISQPGLAQASQTLPVLTQASQTTSLQLSLSLQSNNTTSSSSIMAPIQSTRASLSAISSLSGMLNTTQSEIKRLTLELKSAELVLKVKLLEDELTKEKQQKESQAKRIEAQDTLLEEFQIENASVARLNSSLIDENLSLQNKVRRLQTVEDENAELTIKNTLLQNAVQRLQTIEANLQNHIQQVGIATANVSNLQTQIQQIQIPAAAVANENINLVAENINLRNQIQQLQNRAS